MQTNSSSMLIKHDHLQQQKPQKTTESDFLEIEEQYK